MTIKASDILSVTKLVTKEWSKQRKAEERGRRSAASCRYTYSDRVNFSDDDVYILASAKCNLAERPTSIGYSITGQTVYDDAGEKIPTSKIEIVGDFNFTAEELMTTGTGGSTKADQCAELIRTLLASGGMPATDLESKCKAAGFKGKTYKRGRESAGVKSVKDGFGGGWKVYLKDDPLGHEEGQP